MNIPADMSAILEAILGGLEIGKPIELADVLEVRRLVQEALPGFQVEAYHNHKSVIVGVGLSGIVLVKRELGAT